LAGTARAGQNHYQSIGVDKHKRQGIVSMRHAKRTKKQKRAFCFFAKGGGYLIIHL